MELKIDFYSKEELAIRMDFSGRDQLLANETNELFLFSCYTLRQFSNLGNHPVAKVLAVLLTTFGKDTAIELAHDKYEFPSSSTLHYLMSFEGVKISVDYNVLRDQIMPGMPKLVYFQGEGKKTFTMTLHPFQFNIKGFGLLGFQVNFYAFHSVIALLKYLAKKHIDDEVYLDHLLQVAKYCGKAHIFQKIPLGDQVALANAILKEANITS